MTTSMHHMPVHFAANHVAASTARPLVESPTRPRWQCQNAVSISAPREVLTAQELPGLFHEIFNEPEREQVIQQLLQWLQRFEPQR